VATGVATGVAIDEETDEETCEETGEETDEAIAGASVSVSAFVYLTRGARASTTYNRTTAAQVGSASQFSQAG
jgi:hypothetical protein